jgi:hypothetical protein
MYAYGHDMDQEKPWSGGRERGRALDSVSSICVASSESVGVFLICASSAD